MRKSREQLRNERAEKVCRELRHQLANNFFDANTLFDLLSAWMRVAKNSKYIRPRGKK